MSAYAPATTSFSLNEESCPRGKATNRCTATARKSRSVVPNTVAGSDASEPLGSQVKARKPAAGPYDEARRLLERGDAEGALAALQSAPAGAESQYLQGAAWAKKSETAPLPTPPPAPVPVPRGYVPEPAPEWKPEELRAISFFEEAIASEPNTSRGVKPEAATGSTCASELGSRTMADRQGASPART